MAPAATPGIISEMAPPATVEPLGSAANAPPSTLTVSTGLVPSFTKVPETG